MIPMRSVECAHWHQFFEGIPASPLEFYKSLEEGLKARQVPDTAVSRQERREGGLVDHHV